MTLFGLNNYLSYLLTYGTALYSQLIIWLTETKIPEENGTKVIVEILPSVD